MKYVENSPFSGVDNLNGVYIVMYGTKMLSPYNISLFMSKTSALRRALLEYKDKTDTPNPITSFL